MPKKKPFEIIGGMIQVNFWWGWVRRYCYGSWYCVDVQFLSFNIHYHKGKTSDDFMADWPYVRLRQTHIGKYEFRIPFLKYYTG